MPQRDAACSAEFKPITEEIAAMDASQQFLVCIMMLALTYTAVRSLSCMHHAGSWPRLRKVATIQRNGLCRITLCMFMLGCVTTVVGKDAHAAIHSSNGVQHKEPFISDDFVVACIMIMFLMLFAFGACTLQRCALSVHSPLSSDFALAHSSRRQAMIPYLLLFHAAFVVIDITFCKGISIALHAQLCLHSK